jgi:hypothetical protein
MIMDRVDRAGRIAAVYAALWAAHDLGDHVVQTDDQAANKRHDVASLARHVGGYLATQAAALAALRAAGVRMAPWRVAAGLAVSGLTHAFWDLRGPVLWLLTHTGSLHFAKPVVRTWFSVDGLGAVIDSHEGGVPHDVGAAGALPLHGPYLADQALHHVCVFAAALIIGGGR